MSIRHLCAYVPTHYRRDIRSCSSIVNILKPRKEKKRPERKSMRERRRKMMRESINYIVIYLWVLTPLNPMNAVGTHTVRRCLYHIFSLRVFSFFFGVVAVAIDRSRLVLLLIIKSITIDCVISVDSGCIFGRLVLVCFSNVRSSPSPSLRHFYGLRLCSPLLLYRNSLQFHSFTRSRARSHTKYNNLCSN